MLNPKVFISKATFSIPEDHPVTIYGYTNSTAQRYAESMNFTFIPLDSEIAVTPTTTSPAITITTTTTAADTETTTTSTAAAEETMTTTASTEAAVVGTETTTTSTSAETTPVTTTTVTEDGDGDLPQTGINDLYLTLAELSAVILIAAGIFMTAKSGKIINKDKE